MYEIPLCPLQFQTRLFFLTSVIAYSKLNLGRKDNKGCPVVETSLRKKDSRKLDIHTELILSFVLSMVYISYILFHCV